MDDVKNEQWKKSNTINGSYSSEKVRDKTYSL